MSQSDLDLIINDILIFARMTPELKTDVIKKLKDLGKKVAMVGDDANDLGAIKEVKILIIFFIYLILKADLGLSMNLNKSSIASNFSSMN